MAIKKLQQNFTTIAQSERLLELGLPADSADCVIYQNISNEICVINEDELVNKGFFGRGDAIPIWSVGRLIEIHSMCEGASSSYYIHTFPTNIINEVIWHLTEAIKKGWIDFSKLEE